MWKITHDFLYARESEPERFGAASQVGHSEEHAQIPIATAVLMGLESPPLPSGLDKVAFRLYDDDDELYYQGILDDDPHGDNQDSALKWAEGECGCTTIRVWRWKTGKWEVEIG